MSNERTVTAASVPRAPRRGRQVLGVRSGGRRDRARARRRRNRRASTSAVATASPVPRASPARPPRASSYASRVSGDATTTSGDAFSGRAVSSTQSTIRRPRSGWRCFGVAERMRVPRPAAMTIAERRSGVVHREGWGARIRTWGRGTKTRCLTTWLRPTAGPILARRLLRRARRLVGPIVVEEVGGDDAEDPGEHERDGGDEDRDDRSTTASACDIARIHEISRQSPSRANAPRAARRG